jgi:hypothetical protein
MAAANWKKIYPIVRKGITQDPPGTRGGITHTWGFGGSC